LKDGSKISWDNLQLTGISMTQFFCWYYQNIAEDAPIDFANFKTDVFKQSSSGVAYTYADVT
jgi:hypothetical protein